MTGNAFISTSVLMLGEELNSTLAVQSTLYPSHVRNAMDKLARRCWCFYRQAVADLVEGQVQYRFPLKPYREMAININDGNGNIFPITSITPEGADRKFPNWRATPNQTGSTYQGVPQYIIEMGMQTCSLLPIPNYNCQDGLIVAGYFGIGPWYPMEDESPLDESMDDAIQYGTCYFRCKEMKSIDPTKYGPLEAQYKVDFEERVRMSYRESLSKTESRRAGVTSDKGYRWNLGGSWSLG